MDASQRQCRPPWRPNAISPYIASHRICIYGPGHRLWPSSVSSARSACNRFYSYAYARRALWSSSGSSVPQLSRISCRRQSHLSPPSIQCSISTRKIWADICHRLLETRFVIALAKALKLNISKDVNYFWVTEI